MNIIELLRHKVAEEIEHNFSEVIDPYEIQIQHTKKEFEGDLTIVLFPLAKVLKMKPPAIAENLGPSLTENVSVVRSFQVVGGFLNLQLDNAYWFELLRTYYAEGKADSEKSHIREKVMVEYSSPNTNKPLHLGHIRNNVLGWSVAELLKKRGHEVIKSCLFNDRGAGICRSMLAWKKFSNGETPQGSGKKGDHLVGEYYVKFAEKLKEESKELANHEGDEAEEHTPLMKENREMLRNWEEGEAETIKLWKMMNNWVYEGFEQTYQRMRVDFDRYYYESDTYLLGRNIVNEGLKQGIFYQKEDGSVWVDLEEEKLGEKLLLRSDGTSVYMTQDLGTAQLKYDEYQTDRSLYVVGNEQDYHFQVLKAILKKLNKPYAEGIYHLSYGMVDLPSGKMKSREGTVIDADDLLDEMYETARQTTTELGKVDDLDENERKDLFEMIGQGALKFYILKTDARKRITFDPEESIDFQGFTGPFIQYTHARICSLLRKAGMDKGALNKLSFNNPADLHDEERELMRWLMQYNDVLHEAESSFNPAEIAHYVFHLAKMYNKFYHEHPVKNEKDEDVRNFRIFLSVVVKGTIQDAMHLLGIQVPEKM